MKSDVKQKYLSISEAARYLHVSQMSLRRWEEQGKIKPFRTVGKARRYTKEMLDQVIGDTNDKPITKSKITIGYCRVSSAKRKSDLKRQVQVVTNYCEKKGYQFKFITDIGSGINYTKRGLKELIHLISSQQCDRIVINYKDRLVRWGYELIEEYCNENHVQIEIINQTKAITKSEDQELGEDLMSIITVFAARMYGKRSHKNQKLIAEAKEMLNDD